MKSLLSLCVFTGCVVGDGVKSLVEVYGPLPPVDEMTPRQSARLTREGSALYAATRLPENCIFPLDITIVQDATASFKDDYVQMATVQLPLMTSILSETHPGSEFALLSFQDKPIEPFGVPPTSTNGYYSDYCARINHALTSNITAIQEVYNTNKPNGGGDPSENQFHALLGATQASGLQWSPSPDRSRLIVVVTDAPPHFADDGSDPQNMQESTGTFDESDIDAQCVREFYPSPEQVKASISAHGAYMGFVVYDPDYLEGLVGKSWQWFNRFINQTEAFITLQAEDSSDFWNKLAGIIGVIEEIECLPQLSTPAFTSAGVTSQLVSPTLVGTVASTEVASPPTQINTEAPCPPCPPCPVPPCQCPCPPHPCPPNECPEFTKLCEDGVMIKLGEPIDDLKVVVDGREW